MPLISKRFPPSHLVTGHRSCPLGEWHESKNDSIGSIPGGEQFFGRRFFHTFPNFSEVTGVFECYLDPLLATHRHR